MVEPQHPNFFIKDSIGQRCHFRSPQKKISHMYLAMLFVMPLAIRVILSTILCSQRSYTSIDLGQLVLDPSVFSFVIVTFVILFILPARIVCLLELFRLPLVLFVTYGAIGVIYGILGDMSLLCTFIGYELLIYYVIGCLCLFDISKDRTNAILSLEKVIFYFFSFLMIIAMIDIVLPMTKALELHIDGRKRLSGNIIHLGPIQWAVVASVNSLISLSYFHRKIHYKPIYLLIFILSVLVLFFTGTRGAIAATIISLMYYSYFASKGKKIVFCLIFFYFVMFGYAISLLFPTDIVSNSILRSLRLVDTQNITVLGGRIGLWQNTVEYLLSNPFMGYGIGIRTSHIGSGSMHNFFLEAWRGSGMIGALLLLSSVLIVGINLIMLVSMRSIRFKFGEINDIKIYYILKTAASIYIYVVIHSCVESSIAGVNNFLFLSFMYCLIVSQAFKKQNRKSK